MVRKLSLATIALIGISAWVGCQTPYGAGRSGGCSGGSCAAGTSTYAPAQSGGGGYVPNPPTQGNYGGGSGTYGGGGSGSR